MNTRVLEIIKAPSQIVENDLGILEKEIAKHPYMQSIRALYLYGLHQYEQEKYSSHLATTAAFTTDKKILYHLINNKAIQQQTENKIDETIVENQVEPKDLVLNLKEKETPVATPTIKSEIEAPKSVEEIKELVNNDESVSENPSVKTDEVDLLKFKPENKENLEPKDEAITVENEEVVAEEKTEEKRQEILQSETIEFSQPEIENTELIIEEKKSTETTDNGELSEEISFHGIDDFIPNIAIPIHYEKVENDNKNILLQQQKEEQQQTEMQRLIAEVEAKMKLKRLEKAVETPQVQDEKVNVETNFYQTQDWDLNKKNSEEISPISQNEVVENSNWQPMNLEKPTPTRFAKNELIENKVEEKSNIETEKNEIVAVENSKDEVEIQKSTTTNEAIEIQKNEIKTDNQSNIPQFLGTWHNWLKLDKEEALEQKSLSEEEIITTAQITKEEIKSHAIDVFIENEPKISKLKDSPATIQKEKNDDISHLMTDTLVGLYVEQRLYAKAIRGFELLIEKHPDRKKEYLQKIEEVITLRANPKSSE